MIKLTELDATTGKQVIGPVYIDEAHYTSPISLIRSGRCLDPPHEGSLIKVYGEEVCVQESPDEIARLIEESVKRYSQEQLDDYDKRCRISAKYDPDHHGEDWK